MSETYKVTRTQISFVTASSQQQAIKIAKEQNLFQDKDYMAWITKNNDFNSEIKITDIPVVE